MLTVKGKDYYIYTVYLFIPVCSRYLRMTKIARHLSLARDVRRRESVGRASSVNPTTVISSRHYATLPNGVQLAGNKVRYATSVRNKLGEEVARKRLAEEDAQGDGERKRAGEVKSKRKGTSC